MIANLYKKVNIWCADNRSDLFTASIIFITGLSGFGLGRLSVDVRPNPPLTVVQPADQESGEIDHPEAATAEENDNKVLASRNGATYYYPWCSGAKRIKEENKIWFTTKEAAQKAGFKPAGNCQGL